MTDRSAPLNKKSRRSKRGTSRRKLRCEPLEGRRLLAVVISEFLAENDRGIEDASGHRHDWIELTNTGGATEDVSGWYLTDNASDPTKWQIPTTPATTSLAPGERLLVFASGDNGEVGAVGDELHTNFQLSQEPGYLALVRPDGTTVQHEYDLYPQQHPDVSYGDGVDVASANLSDETLVGDSSSVTAFVPNGPDPTRDDHWREVGYNDAGWLNGVGSIGWDINSDGVNLDPFIGRQISTSTEVDINSNWTVYARYEFDVADPQQLESLALNLRFDDGFIAYLNGREIARANFAEDFVYPQPQWNSYAGHQQGTSSSSGNWNRTDDADQLVTFDLTAYLEFLQEEGNVLAFHGVNSRSSGGGGTNRQDFLIDAELVAGRAAGTTQVGYLAKPSPGTANGIAYDGVIADTSFSIDRGIFDTVQQVAIAATEPGAVIRYTTDFSEPTLTNGQTYSGPLTVAETTVLRVKAFKTGFIPTNVDTQTYIFPGDVITQSAADVTQPYETWGHDKDDEDNTSGYNLDDESDWEMDPEIVTGAESQVIEALKAIPTVSIVTDWDNLWSGTPLPGTGQTDGRVAYEPEGIYIHGRSSERPNSFEYFTADGSLSVQAESVIEIQGHSSPGRWNTDKMSLQVKFKAPYGDPRLDADLYSDTPGGENAVDSFDTLILDAGYNYTWTHPNVSVQSDYARYVTDQVTADLQSLASGTGGFNGRWVHLYLDGLYWGLYNLHERPDENYAADHYGGADDDYYVVKHSTNDIDGLEYSWAEGGLAAEAAYDQLLQATREDLSVDANYQAVEAMLDVQQFADYMIVHLYAGNENDWPHNNWYATFDAASPDGKWRFHAWDQEHAFPTADNGDSFNQFVDLTDDADEQTPGEVFANLIESEEFRLLFSDRVQELMRNDGVLTSTQARSVYQARVDEITTAILAESARWGDNRDSDDPYTQADFLNTSTGVLNTFFPARTNVVLSQFDRFDNDWLVDDAAPTWNQYGGEIPVGFQLTMSPPSGSGVVYYTLDGSDPRDRATGGPSASAVAYSGPITLSDAVRVRARTFSDSSGTANDWSAEVNKEFTLEGGLPLRIVELMYNPAGTSDLEYIELLNTGTHPIDLAGVRLADFSSGGYEFESLSLGAGERIIVPENVAAFQAQYPGVTNVTSTAYSGSLSNGGETVTLIDAFGNTVQSFTYDDDPLAGWPVSPDGDGPALEYVGPLYAGESPLDGAPDDPFDVAANWRATFAIGGSPGADGRLPGDYDNDGDVDQDDRLVWVSSYGAIVAPGIGADGTGDGVVDAADYAFWRDNLGQTATSAIALVTAEPQALSELSGPKALFAGSYETQDIDAAGTPRRGRATPPRAQLLDESLMLLHEPGSGGHQDASREAVTEAGPREGHEATDVALESLAASSLRSFDF